jgi:hypothetical protein
MSTSRAAAQRRRRSSGTTSFLGAIALAVAAIASSPPTVSAAPGVPAFRHIFVIVMENREYGAIVGNPQAPYVNALVRRYGLATAYRAVAHPSEPNYLALWSGSTFGIADDGVHDLSATNLADQLRAHDKTWHLYAQDYPGGCSTTTASPGGVDLVGAPGWYARKHDAAISFTDIAGDPGSCGRITRLAGFSPSAADLEFIVPNTVNDMHDGSIAQGDAFLRAFVPRITSNAAFADSLLLITWDEGSSSLGGGGQVATIVVGPTVKRAYRSPLAHSHYSLLRTIEDAWGLGCMRQTCRANDLGEFFG